MDTNKLKRFATEARNKMRQGVAQQLLTLGFNAEGEASEFPRQLQGATLYRGQQLEESFYDKWVALYEAIRHHGVNNVCEEVAYTWFNRLVAIRILQKNGFIDRVCSFDNPEVRVPHIVSEARQGRFPSMDAAERLRLRAIIADPTKTYEQFALLITAFCHATPIIHRCFGTINDYTELLLPSDILDEGGFIDSLNNTAFISEEDYHTTELLGWLYQFYISEKKDDVFASFKKGKKAESEDIPAATQIFTPNWIVKYMVENTIGRIYLDNNPDSDLQEKMPYLVPQADNGNHAVYTYSQLEELRVIDPACGSGHILLEAFDLLYEMYLSEFYSREEAIEAIFRHNLVGIDLDTRAKQLATFALLLKACQRDNCFLDGHCMPKVLDMPEPYDATSVRMDLSSACLKFIGGYENVAGKMLEEDMELLKDADTLGSIMQFNDDEDYLAMLRHYYDDWTEGGTEDCPEEIQALLPGVELILALTDKYAAVIANPPYMGSGNMNAVLSEYVRTYYTEGKADLFSVFMLLAKDRLMPNGKYGMINMQSWMFLSSFERLRINLLEECTIDSMIHLGPRTFDELSGEVVQNTAFVITKGQNDVCKGLYYRLVDGRNCSDKEQLFLSHINSSQEREKICYNNISQNDFTKIPGSPIGYWVSENMITAFQNSLDDVATTREGLSPADVERFLRLWHEISTKKINKKWFPYQKGGTIRKWAGNSDYVVNWENDGYEIKNNKDPKTGRIRSHNYNGEYSFKEGFTWNAISSGNPCFRYVPTGYLFDSAGSMGFVNNNLLYVIGNMNTIVSRYALSIISPTIKFMPGHILRIPYKHKSNDVVEPIVRNNISISKQDWDAHETSWDFETSPLLAVDAETYTDNINHEIERHDKKTGEHLCIDPAAPELDSLEWRMEQYKQKWEHLFMQLHANEEELNRLFIEIYGLQDELTPDVPLEEITILQQGEISIEDGRIVWHDDVVIKQLVSYAIGCIMGRYCLDKPGLILANQGDTLKEFAEIVPNPSFMPDDNGILPLMDERSPFPDNVVSQLQEWVKVAFGNDHQTENLNLIESALGKSLHDYMVKDFWKDHKKMYQNRPIYWLFSSKKGAFSTLVYMHRMDAYTVGKVRTRYLLPYIEWLKGRIDALMARQSELSTLERRQLRDFNKQLEECREYDIRLHEVANKQTTIDLDDGVVVNYAKYGDVLAKLK